MRRAAGRAWRPALLSALLVLPASLASAEEPDTEPPAVSHEEVRSARVGEPVVVTATITDPSGVFDPTVLYRVGGEGEFLRLSMKRPEPAGEDDWDTGLFEAVIPGEVVSGDLEYFIEAFDERGNGPARYADADLPVKVRVLRTAEPLPAEGSVERPDEDDGGTLWLVAGVAGGALLLAAATAAGVAAFVLLSPPAVPAQVDVVISAPTPIAAGVSP